MSRWITLYTDANPRGWAAWARASEDHPNAPGASGFRKLGSGRIRGNSDSNRAEVIAIIRGLKMVLEHWTDITGVGIKTDSQFAVRLLAWNAEDHGNAHWRDLQTEFRKLCDEHGIRTRIQWVKGHRTDGSVQAYLNNHVDQLAASAANR